MRLSRGGRGATTSGRQLVDVQMGTISGNRFPDSGLPGPGSRPAGIPATGLCGLSVDRSVDRPVDRPVVLQRPPAGPMPPPVSPTYSEPIPDRVRSANLERAAMPARTSSPPPRRLPLRLDEGRDRPEPARRSTTVRSRQPGTVGEQIVALLNDALVPGWSACCATKRHHFTAHGRPRRRSPRSSWCMRRRAKPADRLTEAHRATRRQSQTSPRPLLGAAADYDESDDLKAMVRAPTWWWRVAVESYRQMIALVADKDPTTQPPARGHSRRRGGYADRLADMLEADPDGTQLGFRTAVGVLLQPAPEGRAYAVAEPTVRSHATDHDCIFDIARHFDAGLYSLHRRGLARDRDNPDQETLEGMCQFVCGAARPRQSDALDALRRRSRSPIWSSHRHLPEGRLRPGHATAGAPAPLRPSSGRAEQLRHARMRRRCAELGADRVFDKSSETRGTDRLLRTLGALIGGFVHTSARSACCRC